MSKDFINVDPDLHTLLIEYQVTSSLLSFIMTQLNIEFLTNAFNKQTNNFQFVTAFTGSEFAQFIEQSGRVKINLETSAPELTDELLDKLLAQTRDTIVKAFAHKKRNEAEKTETEKPKESKLNFTKIREKCLDHFLKQIHEIRIIDSFLLERNLIYFFKPILEVLKWQIVTNAPIIAEGNPKFVPTAEDEP